MYKDKAKEKAATTERVRRYREKQKGVTIEGVTPQGVTENVIPVTPLDGWPDVIAYIERDSPRMPNLERLQRIAGSLGSNASEVWFGVTGLTMQDIGEVIGIQPSLYPV